jgi:HlyD family secretion protein
LLKEAQISENSARKNSQFIQAEIAGLELLLRSIEEGKNLIPSSDARHYTSFEDYRINLDRYAALIEKYQLQYDREFTLHGDNVTSKHELESAQHDLESAQRERERYINEFRLNIHRNLENLNRELRDFNTSMQSANIVFNAYYERGYSERLIAEKSRLDTLTSISDALFNHQNSADVLQKELISIQLNIAEARVTAPIDGTINLYTELNVGDFLQSGTEIATILPGVTGEFKVVLAVLNADIAEIREGQIVNFRFNALPFREFGEIEGHVTTISADARNNNIEQSHFLVEAELMDIVLYSRDGKPESIRIGMAVEARVITRNVRIIHWVLEKLNFIDRAR